LDLLNIQEKKTNVKKILRIGGWVEYDKNNF